MWEIKQVKSSIFTTKYHFSQDHLITQTMNHKLWVIKSERNGFVSCLYLLLISFMFFLILIHTIVPQFLMEAVRYIFSRVTVLKCKHLMQCLVTGVSVLLTPWFISKVQPGDFPGGPVVRNLPSNAGDTGSIPGWGTKIPHAVGQLSLCTLEPTHHN